MKRIRVLCLALSSVLAVGVITAEAACAESTPLPDIHTVLSGETYPLALGGHLASLSRLEAAGFGSVLEGTEVSTLLLISEITSLGTGSLLFLGVRLSRTAQCDTLGASEANGEVVVPGLEWHLVYTGLSPSETLELGALMSFPKFTIFCGADTFELPVTGPLLARVNVPTPAAGTEGDSNDIEIASHNNGTKGHQELPYYYNDTLERVPTTLLINVSGTGNVAGAEEIASTLLLTPETGSLATMFSVLY